ncbi:hypothetical protein [uncultured Methylobacterium sp.]|uniref:hypothetical protein n=1 Tax=uncultured Methylobacterium sp. TaxID=157278 RepID=UPI00261047D1|nr:hypothetical protein [uncultured Methylobacterium sp.]
MTGRMASAAFADLAANVFAALLLVLLLLLAAAGRPSRPVDAVRDLGARPHAPLPAAALVEMLRERAPRAGGLALDLTDADPLPALDRALAGPAAPGPVRLYLFSQSWYAPAARRLDRAGLSWREIAVPRALRDPDGRNWSPAFLALLAEADDPARFRAGLGRLLAGGAGARPAGSPDTGTGPGRLFGWVRPVLEAAAILGGVAAVLLIARFVPRTRIRYKT